MSEEEEDESSIKSRLNKRQALEATNKYAFFNFIEVIMNAMSLPFFFEFPHEKITSIATLLV